MYFHALDFRQNLCNALLISFDKPLYQDYPIPNKELVRSISKKSLLKTSGLEDYGIEGEIFLDWNLIENENFFEPRIFQGLKSILSRLDRYDSSYLEDYLSNFSGFFDCVETSKGNFYKFNSNKYQNIEKEMEVFFTGPEHINLEDIGEEIKHLRDFYFNF